MLKLSNLNNDKVYILPRQLNNRTIIFENCSYEFPNNGYLPKFPYSPATKNIFFINCNTIFIQDIISEYNIPNVKSIYIDKIASSDYRRAWSSGRQQLGVTNKLYLNIYYKLEHVKVYITPDSPYESDHKCCVIDEHKLKEMLDILKIFSHNIE